MCGELVTRLDEYSHILLRNIRKFLQIGDGQGAGIIQSNCVGCLAHLAALCELIGWLEPNSKPQMDTVCDSSLERLGHLTQEMSFDGYTYLDLLLRVGSWVDPPESEQADDGANQISWERSLVTFDSRIGCLLHEESASLRYCREIVAAALADIEAKLPNPTPSVLSAQMMFLDGREEGSGYPNFLMVSEKDGYGL